MLGKEDVLLWFKDLESYKRIDVMYELLNMCIPFEIRFLGSCIEEIGKHTYQELRGPSIIANDVDRLAKDASLQAGLIDEATRHRAVIYMSVLTARNCSCANWYYRTLFRTTDPVEHVVKVAAASKEDDASVIHELLLLYTIGQYHPAFTFEQKDYFHRALDALVAHYHAAYAASSGCSSNASKAPAQDALPVVHTSSRNVSSHIDANPQLIIPVKTSSVMPGGDSLPVQHHMPPPGLPPPPTAQNLLLARAPGFPPSATVVGPPEVRPFTAQSSTSLVSQAASPPQSRALSPHQILRPLAPVPGISQAPMHPLHLVACDPAQTTPPLHLESNLVLPALANAPQLAYNSPSEIVIKANDEENHFISEEKPREIWPTNEQLAKNGLRCKVNYMPPHDHLANLKIDDKPPMSAAVHPMHCVNSNSSSGSSRNQSPTETPSVTPHGPGRGAPQLAPTSSAPLPPPPDVKPRVNGMPPPPPPTYIPPPNDHQSPYTVPYTNFPSMPQQSPQQQQPPATTTTAAPPRTSLTCCNCGSVGHTGIECNAQSVEDITQTPYILDYESPTLPENPPEK